ncbi:MAG: ATP-binding protein [Rubrivivax sp.]
MHDRRAGASSPWRHLAGAAWLCCGPAIAADGGGSVGPWLFGSVALVVVAWASHSAGSWRQRASQRRPEAGSTLPVEPPGAPTLLPAASRLLGDARAVLLLEGGAGQWRVRQANPAALRLLGADVASVGRPWSALEGAAPAPLRAALADGASGGGWWLLFDESGRSCLALGPAEDAAADETASLVYTVSHDLRAPIRVVEGFTRIVKEDYGGRLDRVGNDHLDRVLAASARMNQMIDAVLTMARLAAQPLSRQPVDLSQLAGFVVDDLRRAAPEREVDVQLAPDLRVRGDPTLLRLVLENLIGNAWKYTSRTERARIEFSASSDGQPARGRRVFVVRDNGAGFDMRVAERLFGLFQRLHSAKDFPGTGVGLASVRRIVQRHGGEIWAESEPGRGAAFFFTLPE